MVYGRGELHPYSDIDIQILLKRSNHRYKDEIALLWQLAQSLEQGRMEKRASFGLKPEQNNRVDFNFYVEDDVVTISRRKRGAPATTVHVAPAVVASAHEEPPAVQLAAGDAHAGREQHRGPGEGGVLGRRVVRSELDPSVPGEAQAEHEDEHHHEYQDLPPGVEAERQSDKVARIAFRAEPQVLAGVRRRRGADPVGRGARG